MKSFFSIIILLVLFLGSASALLFTTINHNIDIYFSPKDPVYKIDQEIRTHFPEEDLFIFLLENKNLFSDDFLSKLRASVEKLQGLENVNRVLSLTTVDHVQGTDDGFKIAPLFDPQEDFKLTSQERQSKVLSDRLAIGSVISKQGDAVALILRPDKNVPTDDKVTLRTQAIKILKDEQIYPYVTAISGTGEMTYLQFESMLDSCKKFIPLSMLISVGLIWWMFPNAIAIFLSFTIITIAIQMPIALLNLMSKDFTMIHTMVSPLMSALCLAALIHYLNKLKFYSNLGYPPEKRAYMARKAIIKPAAFAALTTVAGLGSFAFTPIPAIQTFGIITAFGEILIFCMVMSFLPPLFAHFDKDRPWTKGHSIDNFLDKVTCICAKIAIRHTGLVLIITALILLIGTPFAFKVKIETDVFKFYGENHPINVGTHRIEDKLVGVNTLVLLLKGQDLDAFKKPENLNYILSLQKWIETQPEVDQTTSMAEMIEDMHWAFNTQKPEFRTIPDNQELITQYLFIYDGKDLFEFVNQDFNTARIVVNLNVHEAGKILSVLKKIESYIQNDTKNGLNIQIAGFGALYAQLSDLVVKTQVYSFLPSLFMIFVFLLIIFRSFSAATICMFPNAAPIVVIFILMGIFGYWLDVGTAMVASVGIGIAVDDTIHLYHTYAQKRKTGHQPVYALMRAYQHAGRSALDTTLILTCQFLVIALSDFLPTQNFGILSAVGIVTAIIFDLFVLPASIMAISRFQRSAHA